MDQYVNRNIHGPEGALLTLQHIDLERLRDSQLQAKVVLYVSNGIAGPDTVTYNGVITTRDQQLIGLGDIALPQAKYSISRINDDLSKKIEQNRLVPAKALFELPGKLAFSIYATTTYEYKGLAAFRDILIPELFRQGYNKYNTNHTSVFWLHAGKDNLDDKTIMCIDNFYGLRVSKSEVDGVKVLTEMDLQRLMNLQM